MLQPYTLKFLKDLKKNNNKPWFDEHRKQYDEARNNFILLVGGLIKSISVFDPPIAVLNEKECLFRINRDVRFSKDKRPYKNNLAGYFNQGGKKSNGSGYYLHIEPGNSFAAGGTWVPEPADLAKIRQEIDYNFTEWKKITGHAVFKKHFIKGIDDTAILVRPPKGYDENNPAIDFLKRKNFVVYKPFTDAAVLDKSFLKEVTKTYQAMKPMVDFLNKAIE